MLQSPTIRKPSAAAVDAASEAQHRRKLFLAMIILFATLIVVVARDAEIWFSSSDGPVAEDDTWVGPSASSSTSAAQTPAVPAVKVEKHVAAKPTSQKSSSEKAADLPPIVASNRTPLPPLGISVASGNTWRSVHLNNAAASTNAAPVAATPATAALVTKVSQKTVAPPPVQAPDRTVIAEYPLLARQMKVQGSVLMQALIAANGVIEDLRVISGPAILATAARQAVLQYHFKPYLQNGQAVETSARVTVNFAIRVVGDQTALRIGGGSNSGAD